MAQALGAMGGEGRPCVLVTDLVEGSGLLRQGCLQEITMARDLLMAHPQCPILPQGRWAQSYPLAPQLKMGALYTHKRTNTKRGGAFPLLFCSMNRSKNLVGWRLYMYTNMWCLCFVGESGFQVMVQCFQCPSLLNETQVTHWSSLLISSTAEFPRDRP